MFLKPHCTDINSPGYDLTSFMRAFPETRSLEIHIRPDFFEAVGSLRFTHGGERCAVSFFVSDDIAGDIRQALKSARRYMNTKPPPKQIEVMPDTEGDG